MSNKTPDGYTVVDNEVVLGDEENGTRLERFFAPGQHSDHIFERKVFYHNGRRIVSSVVLAVEHAGRRVLLGDFIRVRAPLAPGVGVVVSFSLPNPGRTYDLIDVFYQHEVSPLPTKFDDIDFEHPPIIS